MIAKPELEFCSKTATNRHCRITSGGTSLQNGERSGGITGGAHCKMVSSATGFSPP